MKNLQTMVAAAVAMVASVASADLLYWQVSDAVGNELSGKDGVPIKFAYATVKAGGADSAPLNIYKSDGTPTEYWQLYATGYASTQQMNNSTGASYCGSFLSDSASSFLVELWDANDTRVGWQSYKASELANNIWRAEELTAAGGTPLTVTGVIPEPTGGVLLLFGAACLALRRRKRISSTSSRRRHAAALVCALIAVQTVFAAQNDVLVTFSTKGPDKYADGKVVMDGECYALCWSKDFSKFAVKSDGTAEGGEVVLKAPLAKNGRCPSVTFEVDADDAATKYVGGEWAVYLLDTRRFAADGTASVAGAAARAVNTSGLVAKARVGTGSVGSLASGTAAATDVASGVELPKPEITGIKVLDGNVYVTVKGTVPFLAYGLAEGATPDAVTKSVGEQKPGRVSADDEVILVAPAKAGGAFFKVAR